MIRHGLTPCLFTFMTANLKKNSRDQMREWRLKNPEKSRVSIKRNYLSRKIRAISLIGETKCSKCGCNELKFLEFNHIGGGGNKERKTSEYKNMIDRLLYSGRGSAGINILCRVCNALDFLERKGPLMARKFRIIWTS
jgi:hypothetical protein